MLLLKDIVVCTLRNFKRLDKTLKYLKVEDTFGDNAKIRKQFVKYFHGVPPHILDKEYTFAFKYSKR